MVFTPGPRELPVACTLGPTDGIERMQRWQRLLDAADPAFSRAGNRLTVRFVEPAGHSGVLAELEVLAAAERECCAFLDWDVSSAGQPTLTITAKSAEDLDAVAGLFTRPAHRVPD
ncbi:MAG: hypothetical protein ACR2KO_01075 [Geodermatophilaceae bacterium]